MENIKEYFNIKDLENLSGIKAHTIRIWEKRYGILSPGRTDSNIRHYHIDDLKKLLNIALLNKQGHKISRLSTLNGDELDFIVQSQGSTDGQRSAALNHFLVSMITFDRVLFEKTYTQLASNHSFREIFARTFLPLLHHIGLCWQSNQIKPVHEHFISNLIKEKIYTAIENLPASSPAHKEPAAYVLFLPENELHEIGLLFLHYSLLKAKKPSIYLGASVPIDDLSFFSKNYDRATYLTYFTIKPEEEEIGPYLENFARSLLVSSPHALWVTGPKVRSYNIIPSFDERILLFDNFLNLLNKIEQK